MTMTLHTGGEQVTRVDVERIETPEETKTWTPIPHNQLIDLTLESLEASGLRVVDEKHGLARGGQRYFGVFELVNGHEEEDYRLSLGIRNSHDKSFPAALCVGSKVFVCDNLAFSSEIVISRKHTRFIMRDLPQLTNRAVGQLGDHRQHQNDRISAYRLREVCDSEAHDITIRAMDAQVIPVTKVKNVLTEWRKPRHPEFRPRTAWSLFNAFTETLKYRRINDLPKCTQALHGIFDNACGLSVSGSRN